MVARLARLADRAGAGESPRPQAGRRQAEAALRRAGGVCAGEGVAAFRRARDIFRLPASRARRRGWGETTMLYGLALLAGIVAGSRVFTGVAAVSWAARLGALNLDGSWLAFMGYSWTPWIFTLLAIVELVTDQLPSTPSRKVPMQFGARIVERRLVWRDDRRCGRLLDRRPYSRRDRRGDRNLRRR